MPEESEKSATQAFGVIPNVYFDLIARVIPGCFFLFTLSQVRSKNPVSTITDVFMPYEKLHESPTAWMLVIVSAGYVLGHAFSPIVRFLEERPKWVPEFCSNSKKWTHRLITHCLPPFWILSDLSKDKDRLQENYNKLRCQNAGLAALAIRIRAEYTMYGGFAVALTITLLIAGIHLLEALIHHQFFSWLHGVSSQGWFFCVAAVLGVPIMMNRHLQTWGRFRKTVDQLLKANYEADALRRATFE